MKKILFAFISLAMMLSGFSFFQTTALATSPGESIIVNLKKGANNGQLMVNEADLNQAINYVHTAEITEKQADQVNQTINQARQLIDVYAPRATTYSEVGAALSATQKKRLRNLVYDAARTLSLTVSFGQTDSNTSVTPTDQTVDSKDTGATPTTATDSNVVPTLTDKAGRVVYQPASTAGNNGATTIVKQTGSTYVGPVIVGILLFGLAFVGVYLTKRYQQVQD